MAPALARDLAYTPVYLHYNTGLHISTNGRAFAEQLETLLRLWPVPVTKLVLIGPQHGRARRPQRLPLRRAGRRRMAAADRQLVFLGTRINGAPLERGGNWVDVLTGR